MLLGKYENSKEGVIPATEEELKQMWQSYNQFRLDGVFCDVELEVGEQSFVAHRFVLACHSPYFLAMLTNGMKESHERTIRLIGLEEAVVEAFIEYFYTFRINISDSTVQRYLVQAERWGVEPVKHLCCDYIATRLTPKSCITLLKFAQFHSADQLSSKIREYMLEKFEEVANRSAEFASQLDISDIVDLIRDDKLNITSEFHLLQTLLRWIAFDAGGRYKYTAELLRGLRLALINPHQLSSAVSPLLQANCCSSCNSCNSCIRSNLPCISSSSSCHPISWQVTQLLASASDLHMKKLCGRLRMPPIQHPFLRTRIPTHVIFAIGGWSDGAPITLVETYDSKADMWLRCAAAEDTHPRSYHGLAVFENIIYIIGGFDGTQYYNSVKSFNPVDKCWTELACMNVARCYISAVGSTDDKVIFACGGFDGRARLHSAERYSVETNQWTRIQPMLNCRSDAAASMLNGRLYMTGGFNGEVCLSSVEVYDPSFDQWTLVAPMQVARSGLCLVTVEECLYVFGGFDGESRLASCERYDSSVDTWQPVVSMRKGRSNFAVCCMADSIYAIGGFNGTNTINTVERLNLSDEKWSTVCEMTVNRSALKACALGGLANVQEYTAHALAHVMRDEVTLSEHRVGTSGSAVHEAMDITDDPIIIS